MTSATTRPAAPGTKTAFGAERGKPTLKLDPDEVVIETDPAKPLYQRRHAEPPDLAMVASIKAYRVFQPVLVVRGDDGRPYVAAGTRRTIAARQANRELKKEGCPTKPLPAVYCDEKGSEGVVVKIVENAQRKDLPISARAEEARLAIAQGYSEAQVAGWFGVSVSTIKNWTEIPHLHASVQKALDAGHVRLADAVGELARLPKAEQPAALSRLEAERPTRAARKARGEKAERKVTPVGRLKRLEAFLDEHPAALPEKPLLLLTWLRGGVADKNLATAFDGLAGMFETTTKKRKEKR